MATPLPANQAPFSHDEILSVTGGRLVRPGRVDQGVGVCTDSRRVQQGNVFIALQGGRFDGHAYLDDAQQLGASILVVSREVSLVGDAAIVRVPDTLMALGQLARAHRRKWAARQQALGKPGRVVAITGSAGKTTTVRAASAALNVLARSAVHAPVGNLNNAVGVPLVLLGLSEAHAYAIIEVGTNARGEVAYAALIAEPDTAVLTLVACAHGEGIGTIDDIAYEKGALLEAVSREGTAIANIDDPRAQAQQQRTHAQRVLGYGQAPNADVRIVSRQSDGTGVQRIGLRIGAGHGAATVSLRSALLGEAGAYAIAAAMSIVLGEKGWVQDWQAVAGGLENVCGEDGRMQLRELPGGVAVIDDCYNANPASMGASIRAAAELAGQMGRPLILVLGEMRELGADTVNEHANIGVLAARSGANRVLAVAGLARHIAESATAAGADAVWVSDASEAVTSLAATLQGTELVLVKGSRAVALELVVQALGAVGRKAPL